MKSILNNIKTYLVAIIVVLAVIAGAWFYVGSLMENLDKIKPDKGSAFSLNSPITYDQPLLMKLSDFAISILPLGAQSAKAQVNGDIVKYIDAYQNTDVVQTKSFNKLKEDIILKQPGHPAIFEYQIDMAQFDVSRDSPGNLYFFKKGHIDDNDYKLFTIPAPFMVDANGKKSSTTDVLSALNSAGRLVLKPSAEWLAKAKYPVILDPTIEISVINVHSHPQQGENWTVDFTTQGTADLKIIPNDQATIDDDEFVSLSCNGEKRQPQILAGDVIFYPNWNCSGTATVIHYTKKAGNHTLRFEFGGQTAYAYNSAVTLSATGGTVTQSGGYTIHTFTALNSFLDSETTPKTVIAYGNATQSTAQSKFSGASALFDGTGDYLSLADSADWNFGSGDFTIDYWVRPAQVTSQMAAFSQEETDYYPAHFSEIISSQFRWVMRTAGGADIFDMYSSGVTPVANTWYHVALVKNGTSYKMYIDGTERGSATSATVMEDAATAFVIGARPNGGSPYYYWNGYLDEFRVSKGIARWTSNFTPPTSAYSADANTHLLLHADSSTTFTVTGSGSVEYLVVAGGGGGGGNNNGGWAGGGGGAGGMRTGTLSVTGQAYSITVGAGGPGGQNNGTKGSDSVFSSVTSIGGGYGGKGGSSTGEAGGDGGSGGGGGERIDEAKAGGSGTVGQGYNGGSSTYSPSYKPGGGGGAGAVGTAGSTGGGGGAGSSSSISGASVIYATGGNVKTGINGTANTGNGGEGGLAGTDGVGGSGGSGIVIVRYLTGGSPDPIIFRSAYVPADVDAYTKLLLHADGANGSTTFTDSETTPKTVYVSGNAQISTAQSQFGGASGLFDGTGDYLSLADSADWDFGSGDFTIDFWVKFNSTTGTQFFVHRGGTAGGGTASIWFSYTGSGINIALSSNGSAWQLDYTAAWSPGTSSWHHVALVRTGNTIKLFDNGTQLGTDQSFSGSVYTPGSYKSLFIGERQDSGGSAINGYLDEFRVSKGIARWTSDFTLPASAYTSTATLGVPTIFRSSYVATVGEFSATGGTITYTDSNGANPRSSPAYDGGYTVHTFTSSGNLTVTGSGNVDYLVVAGGGGGGGGGVEVVYGGGGAGGVRTGTLAVTSGAKTVTIGNGGAPNNNGQNSVFDSITSTGGGKGNNAVAQTAGSGGSGGGCADAGRGAVNGQGTAGQGYAGGYGATDGVNWTSSGGGGGAGAVGETTSTADGGDGGVGVSSNISGTATYYGGGGGGHPYGAGGAGGGGNATGNDSGDANTGGGGGGGYDGGSGGSGIVIIRYIPTAAVTGVAGQPIIFK